MRGLGATALAAIAAGGYRAAWAVRIALTGGGAVWKYVDWDEGATISAETYTAKPMRVASLPRYASPALAEVRIILPNTDDAVATAARAGTLQQAPVKVYELLSTGAGTAFEAVQFFEGIVEQIGWEEDWAELVCGTSAPLWGVLFPDVYAARCRWKTLTQCPDVVNCTGKYYGACLMYGREAIFGGFRHLPAAGTTVYFRDSRTVLGGGEGNRIAPTVSTAVVSTGALA